MRKSLDFRKEKYYTVGVCTNGKSQSQTGPPPDVFSIESMGSLTNLDHTGEKEMTLYRLTDFSG